jgi:hypothetical protein
MRVFASRLRAAVAASLALCAGCYRYVPLPAVGAPAFTPGSEVRLYLTPEGSARVASALGAPATFLAGRTERADRDSLSVLVSETGAAGAVATTRWVGERVVLPIGAVARGERRLLDRRRSLLVGAGVLLAAATGFVALRAAAGGGAEGGRDPGVVTP